MSASLNYDYKPSILAVNTSIYKCWLELDLDWGYEGVP